MRFNRVVVLVVIALLARAGNVSTSSVSKTIGHGFPAAIVSDASNDNALLGFKRMLRAYESPGEGSEDRLFDWVKLKIWLHSDKPTSYALARLQLNKGVCEAIASSRWNTLEKYVSMVNKKHPGREMSLFKTLRTHYEADEVTKALVSAKHSESASTREIATVLEKQQFAFWRENNISPDDIFFRLKIKGDGQDALRNWKFKTLEEYIPTFNTHFPNSVTDMFTVLRNGFGDADFARVLAMAKHEHSSKTIYENAVKYENELFSKWMNGNKFDTEEVTTKVFGLAKFTDGTTEDKLAINHFNAFYKKKLRELDNLGQPV